MKNIQQEMGLAPVESTNILALAYGEDTLTVRYRSSGVYLYHNVPLEVYQGLLEAASKGGYLHRRVKGTYRCERLVGP